MLIEQYFPQVQLSCIRAEDGRVAGFLGYAEGKVEMLFVDPHVHGTGIGRTLLDVGYRVTVVADVVAVNARTQTLTLRGPQRTVNLRVPDPKQFALVKVSVAVLTDSSLASSTVSPMVTSAVGAVVSTTLKLPVACPSLVCVKGWTTMVGATAVVATLAANSEVLP